MGRLAAEGLREVGALGLGMSDRVPTDALTTAIGPLRSELSGFSCYALVVDDRRDRALSSLLNNAATFLATSERDTLVLLPSTQSDWRARVLEPFPAFATALHASAQWPGLLCWNRSGANRFVPARDAHDAVAELAQRLRADAPLDEWLASGGGDRSKRVLHLSDLHFGTPMAARNLALLEAELFDVVKSVDRVVITGDLFDSPQQDAANAFRAFRNSITRLSGAEPVIVPGNHDQRILGNVGQDFRQVASLDFRSHVIDKKLGVAFLCFNSSEEGRWARGRISANQFTQVAGDWRNALATDPAIRTFLPIVLVHHHPFSYGDTKPHTWVQRALVKVGLSEERFLSMENADEFLAWCARWRFPVVLHGHKHIANFFDEEIDVQGLPRQRISAIACGSSLGAEGTPISYNIVRWDDSHRRWTASFFESIGGGPFAQKAVLVDRAGPTS